MPIIRRASMADIDALTALRQDLLRELGEITDQADLIPLIEATRNYFIESLPTDKFMAWVAEVDGKIVGTSGLALFRRPPYPGNLAGSEAYVLNIYTVPEWRGRGVATALVNAIVAFVKTTDVRRVWLHASRFGKGIYEKVGFISVSGEMELRQ